MEASAAELIGKIQFETVPNPAGAIFMHLKDEKSRFESPSSYLLRGALFYSINKKTKVTLERSLNSWKLLNYPDGFHDFRLGKPAVAEEG